MASVEKRLEALEESLRQAAGARGGLEERLWREAYRTLSIVEMHVMGELQDAYGERPGSSPAEVWHDLTEAQRSMQYRWLDAVRNASRTLADSGPSEGVSEEERAELRELVREIGNYPFFEKGGEDA